MICPNCQSDNKEGAKFCNECGFPLTGRIATVAAAQEPEDALRRAVPSDKDEQPAEHEGLRKYETIRSVNHAADESQDDPFEGAEVDREDDDDFYHVPQTSGPLDRARLPIIGVAGVDVDEDGNEFSLDEPEKPAQNFHEQYDENYEEDFEEKYEQHYEDYGEDYGEDYRDNYEDHPDDYEDHEQEISSSSSPNRTESKNKAPDRSGVDECLVDSGYTPPESSWKSGGTMEMPRVGEAETPQKKEFRAPEEQPRKHRRGRVILIVAIVLLVVVSGAAALTYQMELWGGKIIPNVEGMTQADATFQLQGKGFTVRVLQVRSDEAEGIVVLSDPAANGRAEKGSEVVIQVAVSRVIPEVVGKSKDEASKLLTDAGFNQLSFTEQKSNETEGTILSISPDTGSKAKGSTPLTLNVSVPFTVPDVTNKSQSDAAAELEAAGYHTSVSVYYTESIQEGLVVGTSPAAGEKLDSGSTVNMSVAKSRANELVAAARAYLKKGGTITIGGVKYEIVSVDNVSAAGHNQTTFTVTASAVTTLDGETVRGSAKQKSGTITWDDANNIVSIG